jgi:hypothetical protein
MTKEEFNYGLPPQYQQLLKDSLKKIDNWGPHEIGLALEGIIRPEKDKDGVFYPYMLLKAISTGQFPFIVLVQITDQFSVDKGDNPDSISLIPDPMQVPITSGGNDVSHVISGIAILKIGVDTVKRAQIYTRGILMRQPFERESFKPKTIAIARTMSLSTGTAKSNSLTFGFPYKDRLKEIEMGSINGLRR